MRTLWSSLLLITLIGCSDHGQDNEPVAPDSSSAAASTAPDDNAENPAGAANAVVRSARTEMTRVNFSVPKPAGRIILDGMQISERRTASNRVDFSVPIYEPRDWREFQSLIVEGSNGRPNLLELRIPVLSFLKPKTKNVTLRSFTIRRCESASLSLPNTENEALRAAQFWRTIIESCPQTERESKRGLRAFARYLYAEKVLIGIDPTRYGVNEKVLRMAKQAKDRSPLCQRAEANCNFLSDEIDDIEAIDWRLYQEVRSIRDSGALAELDEREISDLLLALEAAKLACDNGGAQCIGAETDILKTSICNHVDSRGFDRTTNLCATLGE